MANAMLVLVIETELPIDMTCADVAIAKGQALKLSSPFTVGATSAGDDEFGGVAAAEKIAGDGKLTIPVYRGGIFKAEAGTTGVSVGKHVKIEANNEFTDLGANENEAGYGWGSALETATNGQFFLLDLGNV